MLDEKAGDSMLEEANALDEINWSLVTDANEVVTAELPGLLVVLEAEPDCRTSEEEDKLGEGREADEEQASAEIVTAGRVTKTVDTNELGGTVIVIASYPVTYLCITLLTLVLTFVLTIVVITGATVIVATRDIAKVSVIVVSYPSTTTGLIRDLTRRDYVLLSKNLIYSFQRSRLPPRRQSWGYFTGL
jgi:hypothetical protein